jgi:hypothetical protein
MLGFGPAVPPEDIMARMTLHEIIARRIDETRRSQKEMAAALGYRKPNIITMFKQGLTKIPLHQVIPIADLLGLDRAWLLRTAIAEYDPTLLAGIDIMLDRVATPNERLLLTELRKLTDGKDPPLVTARQRQKLGELAEELVRPVRVGPSPRRDPNKPLTPPPPGEDWSDG